MGVAQAGTGKIGRVLVVDDEAIIRGMLQIELADHYEVFVADGGQQALDLLSHQTVDLVVSDINMPGMRGPELLERVRQLYPATRLALITAYNTDDFIRTAKEHNICSIIPKATPFNFDEFDAVVRGLVTQEIFGLERYLQPQHTIEERYTIEDSDRIGPVEEDIMRRVGAFYRPEPFVQILLEELITNAVYHAPADNSGQAKYAKHSQVVLQKDEAVGVTLGRDSEKFGVSVVDRGGRLTREQVLYHLDRHISAEGVFDENGRGLHMSRLYADRLIINIRRGYATEVIFLVYLEKKYIGFRPLYINEI
jgi:CheY-like chemotaxis protein/anti-sigma regulatory factor (Ser/Thr protein kinase)